MSEKQIKPSLLSLNRDEIAALLPAAPAYTAGQIFKFLHDGKDFEQMTSVSKGIRASLSDEFCTMPLCVEKVLIGRDGTKKYLFKLSDDELIEGVFMTNDYGSTLCASTQVGCRMGCAFCASGQQGLARNLSAGEILGQVVKVNAIEKEASGGKSKVTNVVLMGSGEPLDNYDNTLKFLELVNDPAGINLSIRNISVSTSGLCDKIRRLADCGKTPTLSISLHAANDALRNELMPVNRKFSVAEVVCAAKYYFAKTGRRVIFEYALIAGKNDKAEDADALSMLVAGFPAHVNLIRLNAITKGKYAGSDLKTAQEFLARLRKNGTSATLRRSLGGDIEGACGQLKRKYLSDTIERAAKPIIDKTT